MAEAKVKTINLPLRIKLLEDKKGKVVGFNGKILRDTLYECFDFVEHFPVNYKASIVVRVVENTLVFDDSLGRGIRWNVPLSVPQAQKLHGLFRNSTAYPRKATRCGLSMKMISSASSL